MRSRFALLFLLPALSLPLALEAQRTGGQPTFTPYAIDRLGDQMESPEAELFLELLGAIRSYSLTPQDEAGLWEKAIEGLLKELDDPYATVLSPEEVREFEEQSTGNYAGIGVQITELNEVVTITAVFRDTPADRAGLQVGDRIVAVNGESAEGWSVSDASEQIRGDPGTVVEVTVARDGISQPIPNRIERAQVHVPAVSAERIFEDVGYVHLDRVARNSAAEVDSVLAELGEVRGLILDLRRNPGGYLDESLSLADLFLDRGSVLVKTRSRSPSSGDGVQEDAAHARRVPRMSGTPIVVLVDRYSASASEIVAGALQDHDRALVLGERTFGKGSVQSVIPLPGGRLLRLTSGEWYSPLGRSLNRPRDRDGRVIEPDSIPVFTSQAGRALLGGGGVAPDLELAGDTLTTTEQGFHEAAVEAEIPFSLRIREAALAAGREFRENDVVPETLPEGALDDFIQTLVESGLPEAALTPDIREYLRWQLEMTFFQQLEPGAPALQAEARRRALEVRSERDPVLASAIRLLKEAGSQEELFVLAAEEPGAVRASAERGGEDR